MEKVRNLAQRQIVIHDITIIGLRRQIAELDQRAEITDIELTAEREEAARQLGVVEAERGRAQAQVSTHTETMERLRVDLLAAQQTQQETEAARVDLQSQLTTVRYRVGELERDLAAARTEDTAETTEALRQAQRGRLQEARIEAGALVRQYRGELEGFHHGLGQRGGGRRGGGGDRQRTYEFLDLIQPTVRLPAAIPTQSDDDDDREQQGLGDIRPRSAPIDRREDLESAVYDPPLGIDPPPPPPPPPPWQHPLPPQPEIQGLEQVAQQVFPAPEQGVDREEQVDAQDMLRLRIDIATRRIAILEGQLEVRPTTEVHQELQRQFEAVRADVVRLREGLEREQQRDTEVTTQALQETRAQVDGLERRLAIAMTQDTPGTTAELV